MSQEVAFESFSNISYCEDILVDTICSTLMHGQDYLVAKISSLIQSLGHHDQISFFHSMLRVLSKQPQFLVLDNGNHSESHEQNKAVSAGAAIIFGIIQDSVTLRDGLMNWIIGVSGDGFAHNIRMHRSGIAALSEDGGMSDRFGQEKFYTKNLKIECRRHSREAWSYLPISCSSNMHP